MGRCRGCNRSYRHDCSSFAVGVGARLRHGGAPLSLGGRVSDALVGQRVTRRVALRARGSGGGGTDRRGGAGALELGGETLRKTVSCARQRE